MIRTIITIVLAVVTSCATTYWLVTRYTVQPAVASSVQVPSRTTAETAMPQAPVDPPVGEVPALESIPVPAWPMAVEPGPATLHAAPAPVAPAQVTQVRVDYQRLNRDLQTLSDALNRFNNVVEAQVTRVRSQGAVKGNEAIRP